MFLVIPLVEFLHVLDVDINVHHENPATFLCHMSVSSVKRSRHRFASSRWRSSVSSRHTAMKFRRNHPGSQPIVRVARLAGPELVALLHSRRTSAFVVCLI